MERQPARHYGTPGPYEDAVQNSPIFEENPPGDKFKGIDVMRTVRTLGSLPAKPPYGALTAIDLNTGEHRWQVTVGDDSVVRASPALRGVPLRRCWGTRVRPAAS